MKDGVTFWRLFEDPKNIIDVNSNTELDNNKTMHFPFPQVINSGLKCLYNFFTYRKPYLRISSLTCGTFRSLWILSLRMLHQGALIKNLNTLDWNRCNVYTCIYSTTTIRKATHKFEHSITKYKFGSHGYSSDFFLKGQCTLLHLSFNSLLFLRSICVFQHKRTINNISKQISC